MSAVKYDATMPAIVSEIWDSLEQFEAFGQRLMPILAAGGIDLFGPPEIVEIHNVIKR